MLSAVILLGALGAGALLLWPRLSAAPLWRATITPLASIIGSGFLVLGPFLNASYGGYAPLVMAGLCAVAYLFGTAIRFNIARRGDGSWPTARLARIESAASAVLAFAYVISVAYYLNLLGAFAVSLTPFNTPYAARLVTSAVFVVILLTGWTRGFSALERMEQVTVGLKLAVIAGLLLGLSLYFAEASGAGALSFEPLHVTGWAAVTLAAGLIVTVQGFETSRYLSGSYAPALRIRSMRLAQWVSTVIYLLYILLIAYTFDRPQGALSETAIIDLMALVAPVLPAMLVVAALSAQFSAAVADTSGSGGLIAELSRGRISEKGAYGLLVGIGLALTWGADLFAIISYASRAFAAYYALQAAIAASAALSFGETEGSNRKARAALFGALALLGAAIALFGTSVE